MKPTIHYIANVRLPTPKAHGIQITSMCEAFKNNGYNINLYYPKRHQIDKELNNKNIFTYFHITNKFSLNQIPNVDFLYLSKENNLFADLIYIIQYLTFSLSCLTINTSHKDIIYTREKLVTIFFKLFKKRSHIIYEAHDSASNNIFNKFLAKSVDYVVVISKSIELSYQHLNADTIYAPDGVGEQFFATPTQTTCRKFLNLPPKQKIAIYTGQLYSYKGVDTIYKSANILKNIHFYIVGGEHHSEFPKTKIKYSSPNLHFVGNKSYPQIPLWLKAADMLIIPNSAKFKKGKQDTSPLKLFEYMASGVPIIASKVESITQILSDKDTIFFKPDSVNSLVRAIKMVFKNKSLYMKNAKNTKLLAKKYTWMQRVKNIMSHI